MKKRITALIGILCLLVSLAGTAAMATGTKTNTNTDTSTGSNSDTVTVNGQSMTISSTFDASVPEGFYETKLTYNGTTYYGGIDKKTESLQLFYLINSGDASLNGFYLLGNDGLFRKYNSVSLDAKTLMVLTPDSSVTVPAGYSETRVPIGNSMTTVWKSDTSTVSDVYLVYGTLDGTTLNWFIYDQGNGTVSLYDSAMSDTVAQQTTQITDLQTQLKDLNTKYNTDISKARNIYLAAIILCLLFLFLMLNAMMKRHHTTLDLEERIIDLKRNGGHETQRFTKREMRRNAKRDAKAERRLSTNPSEYDDDEDLTVGEAYRADEERVNAAKRKSRDTGRRVDDSAAMPDDASVSAAVPAAESVSQAVTESPASLSSARPDDTGVLPDDDLFWDDEDEPWEDEAIKAVQITKSSAAASKEMAARSPMADATKRIDPDKRVVTMAAAGDSSDFDLDLLEKNLARMTDKVMTEEEEAASRPPEPVIPRTPAKATSADIAEVVRQDDEDDDFKMDIINLDD